ncbi:MAG: extracellular catalytic domain type 1 short-chain-length polyhydroxyalkanoate depolymerase [Janthinobacterium lividum]
MTQPYRAGMIGARKIMQAGGLGQVGTTIQRSLSGEMPQRVPRRAAPRSLLDGMMNNFQDAMDNFQSFNPFTPPEHVPLPPLRGSFTEVRFATSAGNRNYKLYVPACAESGVALPLVVMLHGCTQSPDDFAAGTRMNHWAERDGFLVCYPAQSASANGQKCWNWFNDGDQKRDLGEPALIAGMTREVMRHHPVDQARVYVAGLSAGGALAATMGQVYPDLYAAVGVHSGLACGAAHDISSAFSAMRQGGSVAGRTGSPARVPTIVFHGDRDSTVNAVNGDEVAAQAIHRAAVRAETENGDVPGGHAYQRTRYLDTTGRAIVEQWAIHGAGHAWAGGSAAGSYTDPRGPDASGEMLRFFSEHAGSALIEPDRTHTDG